MTFTATSSTSRVWLNMADNTISSSELQTILNSSINPTTASQLLSSCPPVNTFNCEDEEPSRIFLAFLRFIITNLSDGYVVGIWDELLNKTVKYSKNFTYSRRVHSKEIQGVNIWIPKVLCPERCPSHYTRMELFRLARVFKMWNFLSSMKTYNIFFHTVVNINTHRFYPSGNGDDLLFGVKDLHYIVTVKMSLQAMLQNKKETIVYSDERKIYQKCVQLVGIFAALANSITDPKMRAKELDYGCATFRNITSAIVTLANTDRSCNLMPPMDSLKSNKLPMLLLDRQVHGSKIPQNLPLLLSQLHVLFTRNKSSPPIMPDIFTCAMSPGDILADDMLTITVDYNNDDNQSDDIIKSQEIVYPMYDSDTSDDDN